MRRPRTAARIGATARRFSAPRTSHLAGPERHAAHLSKLVLISLLLATIALPAIAAQDENPRRGLRRTIKYMALFYAFYLFGLLFLYGRF